MYDNPSFKFSLAMLLYAVLLAMHLMFSSSPNFVWSTQSSLFKSYVLASKHSIPPTRLRSCLYILWRSRIPLSYNYPLTCKDIHLTH